MITLFVVLSAVTAWYLTDVACQLAEALGK